MRTKWRVFMNGVSYELIPNEVNNLQVVEEIRPQAVGDKRIIRGTAEVLSTFTVTGLHKYHPHIDVIEYMKNARIRREVLTRDTETVVCVITNAGMSLFEKTTGVKFSTGTFPMQKEHITQEHIALLFDRTVTFEFEIRMCRLHRMGILRSSLNVQ